MEINILSYKFFDQNGGSFELIIDDVSLAEQVDYKESFIPYWIIDNGIPTFPPFKFPKQISERVISVCGCGEYGCDCITCQVKIEDDFVYFSNFKRPGYSRMIDKTFRFTKENFSEVENQLASSAEKIKKDFENQS
jgi:hypothetical protein